MELSNILDICRTGAMPTPEDSVTHNNMVQWLGEHGTDSLPAAARFTVYRYLQRVIRAYTHLWEDENRDTESMKLESFFGDELRVLENIAANTQFSSALYEWARARNPLLIEAIEDPDFYSQRLAWEFMDLKDREAVIVDFMRLQAEIYGEGLFPFLTPPLEVRDDLGGAEGMVAYKSCETGSLSPARIPVILERALLERQTAPAALLRAHHEMMHHMMVQLALAVRDNRLQPGHPLYEDAALHLARMENGGAAHSAIRRIYRADGDETLAYDQELIFFESLKAAAHTRETGSGPEDKTPFTHQPAAPG